LLLNEKQMPKSRGVYRHITTGARNSASAGRKGDPMILNDVPADLLNKIYNKRVISPKWSFWFDGCLVSAYAPNSSTTSGAKAGGPRIAFQRDGDHWNLLCKWIYMKANGNDPPSSNVTASHLCGNAYCISHCIWETLAENVARNNCHESGSVSGCEHQPRCLQQPSMHKVIQAITAHQKEHNLNTKKASKDKSGNKKKE